MKLWAGYCVSSFNYKLWIMKSKNLLQICTGYTVSVWSICLLQPEGPLIVLRNTMFWNAKYVSWEIRMYCFLIKNQNFSSWFFFICFLYEIASKTHFSVFWESLTKKHIFHNISAMKIIRVHKSHMSLQVKRMQICETCALDLSLSIHFCGPWWNYA